MVANRIDGATVASAMAENGVIFSDGIEADFLDFNAGPLAIVGVAERQGVLVASGASR